MEEDRINIGELPGEPADGNEGRMREPDADFFGRMDALFALPGRDYTQYSPLVLAYIGDAVYDLVIRTVLVRRANMQPAKLHRKSAALVNAGRQARLARHILPLLTQEEQAVLRRGSNAKPATMAKNASREDYLLATGLEALVGYLFLCRRYDRLLELIAREEALRPLSPRERATK